MFQRALFYYASSFSTSSSRLSTRTLRYDSRKARLLTFEDEWRRQADIRSVNINKVIVTVNGHMGEQRQLLMNDRASTFHDCAKHISRHKSETAALIAIQSDSGTKFSSVHEVINGDSTIRFLTFTDPEHIEELNKAYWRSCAFVLGAIAETSFRSPVNLESPLPSPCEKGRFGYAVSIEKLRDWNATESELNILTRTGLRNYIEAGLPFLPLNVDRQLAAEMFDNNPTKKRLILNDKSDTVMLYKMGDHVDVADGPLIANTRQIGRFAVTKVEGKSEHYHFYGVSVPTAQNCSSFSWDLILAASKQGDGFFSRTSQSQARV